MKKSRYRLHESVDAISRILDFVPSHREDKIGTKKLGIKIINEKEFLKMLG